MDIDRVKKNFLRENIYIFTAFLEYASWSLCMIREMETNMR